MSTAKLIIATVFDGLAQLEPGSVDLVLSSPPFLALRSYLPADHPTKAREIGSEATPADFIDTLLDVVEACDRVLAPHGSLVFELGDTYSGSGGAGGDYNEGGLRDGAPAFTGSARAAKTNPRRDKAEDRALGIIGTSSGERAKGNPGAWPLDKSLTGIPTLFAWSLAYGRNLLRPERTTEPWRIRNVIAWCRPNPAVGALGDKFRPATSYLTVATKSRTRYFDLDAVRGPGSPNTHPRLAERTREESGSRRNTGKAADERRGGNFTTLPIATGDGTAPPLDWWEIPTAPYKGSHYATWPPDLLVKPIKAMCPERVCTVCGEPSRRIVESVHSPDGHGFTVDRTKPRANKSTRRTNGCADRTTLGWTDCGCPDLTDGGLEIEGSHAPWRNGVVLDPFAGSGTTLAVATGHGRDAIGIDLDERNADLARERCGMFLEVVELATEATA